jgi:protease-4
MPFSANINENSSQLAQVLQDYIKEQRRKRRWEIFFKLVIVGLVIVFFLAYCTDQGSSKMGRDEPHTALISLEGEVMANGPIDANKVASALRMALKDPETKGVILRINSPGGSPVQADYIYNEIMRLRHQYPDIPVYAVCTEMCASAAYYIASATKDIYANPASMVGSIGVIMKGFGFTDAMKKIGVTQRTIIAGKYKDFMDPFAPLDSSEEQMAQNMVDIVHQQFISAVEAGRGARLQKDNPDIFSGLIWTGVQAKKLGLIDAYGSTGFVARNVIKQEKIVDYTIKPNPFERFADRIGASAANVILSQAQVHLSE